MRKNLPKALFVVALVLLPTSWGVAEDNKKKEPKATVPACVKWKTEARYRPYGYDHLVHIKNECELTAKCEVSTNVNPEVQKAEIKPREEKTVITYLGSPWRAFEPIIECKLD